MDRDEIIAARRAAGQTLQRIGAEVGLAKERVRQVLVKRDLSRRRASVAHEALQAGGPRSIPVKSAPFSSRVANALYNENLLTLGDVADEFPVLNHANSLIPNLGTRSVNEIKRVLADHNLFQEMSPITKVAASHLYKDGTLTAPAIVERYGEQGMYGRSRAFRNRFPIPVKYMEEIWTFAEHIRKADVG